MKYFIELTLIESSGFSLYKVWGEAFMQVHLAFVEQQSPDKTVNFGVSFPGYLFQEKEGKSFGSLGDKLRVFANTEQELKQLNLSKWLERLEDYVHIKSIKSVPEKIDSYLQVKRYRANTNLERLTRRFMRRESKRTGNEVSFEQAKALQNERFAKEQFKKDHTNDEPLQSELFAKERDKRLEEAKQHYLHPKLQNFPFIKLKSLSGNRGFSLQIEQVEVSQSSVGAFSSYGLSSQSTVPHW